MPAHPSEPGTGPPARETRDLSQSGIAAVMGGIAWIVYALLANSMPVGCVGSDACEVAHMRDTGDLTPLLLVGAVLIPSALLEMARAIRSPDRPLWVWQIGASAATAATAVAVVGMVVSRRSA